MLSLVTCTLNNTGVCVRSATGVDMQTFSAFSDPPQVTQMHLACAFERRLSDLEPKPHILQ